jgi:pyruvate dehydrogenase E1 component
LLEREHGIAAEVWSVTSWGELRREAREADAAGRASWVARCLGDSRAPVVAASDYVSAVADLIRAWVPGRMVALGTDGFGRSDTRQALRDFFGVSAAVIARAALGTVRG